MIEENKTANKPHNFKFMQVKMKIKAKAKANMTMSDRDIDKMINNLMILKQSNHGGSNLDSHQN